MKIDLYTQSGEKKGDVQVSDAMFKTQVNEQVLRLAVIRQMANSRQVLAHTKTRADVRGGGKKPWRQKGTGRARFGSTRNPVWVGGGIAFGPRNERNFEKNMTKKARRLALFSALSQRVSDGSVFALSEFKAKEPKTKDFASMMSKLPSGRSLLVILASEDATLVKSAANLPNVKTLSVSYLNPYDLLHYDKVMFMEPALKKAEELFL